VDKIASTPEDPSVAVIDGIRRLGLQHGIDVSAIAIFAHGSTVATNAMLELKLPPTALLVTRGFRDVLEIATQVRHNMFDLTIIKVPPIVPRHRVIEVEERVDRDGEVVRTLTPDEMERVVDEVERAGVEACAISFLFSFRNPVHEMKLADLLRERLPGIRLALSSEVSPVIKEYQRTSTTAVSASLQPLVANYIGGIRRGLDSERVSGAFFVMQSSGGVMTAAEAERNAHKMILSGPAAGVIAASRLAEIAPYKNQITFDMGGTSTDICLIHEGRPRVTKDTVFEGRPLTAHQIDIHTIGSGGGSIAYVDTAGLLHVGPQSAGATPGPACYGLGGTNPTVTDAHLVLGRLDPGFFLGGEMELDAEAAHAAIVREVAEPLQLSVEEAASGILDVADAVMARGIRVVSVNRGYDPRDFALVAFGGAGPMHALSAGQLVDIGLAIIPQYPGAFSAMGLVNADIKYDLSQPVERPVQRLTYSELETEYQTLIQRVARQLDAVAHEGVTRRFVRLARLRYTWQDHAIEVVVGQDPVNEQVFRRLIAQFHDVHNVEFGHSNTADPVEVVSVGVEGVGVLERPPSGRLDSRSDTQPTARASRQVFFRETGWIGTNVYDRGNLSVGNTICGPATVEEREATTLIGPRAVASVDEWQNLVLTLEPERRP
jgi:N-methylhydantoinase A